MTENELLDILARGEDSRHQFKRDFTNGDALAAELTAFANGRGGRLIVGISDAGHAVGLSAADIQRLNQLLSNAASRHVKPPLSPISLPNLAGLLLFGKNPQRRLHVCLIAAVCFPRTKLSDSRYLDSENIDGTLEEQYQRGMAFIKRNLHHVQSGASFNSPSVLEVSEAAFEALLVNALVHRDFFISATVRLFIFSDRVEIISPGHLPDSLTPEQIRAGLSNRRNKVLAEHAAHILPYRGLGTGIPRALGAWPKIDLIDEHEANQFRAVVWRPRSEQVTEQVTPEVTPEVMNMLTVLHGEMGRGEIMAALGLKDEKHFREHYQQAGISLGVIEMTIPDKPKSSKQRYRLTKLGRVVVAEKNKEEPKS